MLHIVAVATIPEGQCLFHSELLIVQLLFKGGDYSKKYNTVNTLPLKEVALDKTNYLV